MGFSLILAGIAALANWYAVERDNKRVEYVAKPATTALLLLAALAIDSPQDTMRSLTVFALGFCLAGDVFLMLPQNLFVPGLASFLVGHVLFIVAFATHEPSHSIWPTILIGVAVLPVVGRPVLQAVKRDHAKLFWPVLIYIVVITTMFGASGRTGSPIAIAGAAVFMLSDRILAHNRFIRPFAHAQLATMVTYHAALTMLVLALR